MRLRPRSTSLPPVYETANIAMDQPACHGTMKRWQSVITCAACCTKKPFAGVNGPAKHDNWSITTDTGMNLLDPGETPNENIQFVVVLACVIKAVDTHADLLRRRLKRRSVTIFVSGASEAPPAIVSVFLGTQLEDVVRQLVKPASPFLPGGSTLHTAFPLCLICRGCDGQKPILLRLPLPETSSSSVWSALRIRSEARRRRST